jgi:hypothetical protein
MNITINVSVADEEANQLAGILRCTREELEEVLQPFASAAAEEYVRMFLGQKVFTRGSDFREYRLFLLIQYAFSEGIPDEQRVCDLFQTTVPQSRSLIRSVMSKYQYELENTTDKSLRKAIEEANYSEDHDYYIVTVGNSNIVDSLNQLIASADGTLPPIKKRRNTVSTYIVPKSSRRKLAELLGIELPEGDE